MRMLLAELIEIRAKTVMHGRYWVLKMAQVAMSSVNFSSTLDSALQLRSDDSQSSCRLLQDRRSCF